MTSLNRRGLRPVHELAADRQHGDRLKYLAGCRCLQCRAANSNYETQRAAARRAGDWNGTVPAWRARRHILKLSKKGIGRRSWKRIRRLLDEGFTKAEIARRLGLKSKLQIRKDCILARTAVRVERLFNQLMA